MSTARSPGVGAPPEPQGKVRAAKSNKPCCLAFVLAALFCTAMLSGCGKPLQVDEVYGGYHLPDYVDSVAAKRVAKIKPKAPASPERARVDTPVEPDCGAQKGRPELADGAAADPNAELATRIRLEYERECYRQAEARMRDRVKQLQGAKAAKATEPSERRAQ
jgi:hypothetical protein